jgi:hypothetical protein
MRVKQKMGSDSTPASSATIVFQSLDCAIGPPSIAEISPTRNR